MIEHMSATARRIRQIISEIRRQPKYHLHLQWGEWTHWMRPLPDFIIIGAQRCGTTSLYNYMIQHPQIDPVIKKIVNIDQEEYREINFFDRHFAKGVNWYRAHFPCIKYKYCIRQKQKQKIITGEGTPDYIFHPHAPRRIAKILPRIKLIVLLRNPVDRAYSHFRLQDRRGLETLSFAEAITRESKRLNREEEKLISNEYYQSIPYFRFSYLKRGIYIEQLKRWYEFFPKEQILILSSEDFYNNPAETLKQIFSFLNLPDYNILISRKYQSVPYPAMDSELRGKICTYFRPHNERLYQYIGRNFSWAE